jgi:hypothetical protein
MHCTGFPNPRFGLPSIPALHYNFGAYMSTELHNFNAYYVRDQRFNACQGSENLTQVHAAFEL